MTEIETSKIIASIIATFPNYKPVDIKAVIKEWTIFLSDYSYEEVSAGLKIYILSNDSGFAPSIGQIVDKIRLVSKPQELNEMEAWSLVSKAIRNSGYNSVEEFSKLPKIVQKAVGIPEQLRTWALDEDFKETVVMSHFINCYRIELKRAEEMQKMPTDIRRIIEKASEKVGIERKEHVRIEEKRDYKGVPMPKRIKARLEEMKNH